MMRRDESGFTVVEMMTVVLILGVLMMIAVPAFTNARAHAAEGACLANRTTVARADYAFYLKNGDWSAGIDDLVGDWIKSRPVCPDDGVYAWIDTPSAEQPVRTLGCCVQYFPVESLTPLGSTFSEISRGIIQRMLDYYAKYGRWPSTRPPASYTDLGLTEADWSAAIENLHYTPSGSRLSVSPADGWEIVVVDLKGKTRTVEEKDVIYDAETDQWYYKEIKKNNRIDITTLQVRPAEDDDDDD